MRITNLALPHNTLVASETQLNASKKKLEFQLINYEQFSQEHIYTMPRYIMRVASNLIHNFVAVMHSSTINNMHFRKFMQCSVNFIGF